VLLALQNPSWAAAAAAAAEEAAQAAQRTTSPVLSLMLLATRLFLPAVRSSPAEDCEVGLRHQVSGEDSEVDLQHQVSVEDSELDLQHQALDLRLQAFQDGTAMMGREGPAGLGHTAASMAPLGIARLVHKVPCYLRTLCGIPAQDSRKDAGHR